MTVDRGEQEALVCGPHVKQLTGHRKKTLLEPALQNPVLRGYLEQSESSLRQQGRSGWWGQGTSHWLSGTIRA